MPQDDPEPSLARRAPPKNAPEPGAPAAPRYRPGDVVGGKYRLEGLLGQGLAGDVWLAHNDTLDIDVAVKLIRWVGDVAGEGAGGNAEAAQRLLIEARAAARLGHPAIVRILDFGRAEGGAPFIVMERLVGEDLASAVKRRGRLSAETAARTLLPIAHALAVAHGKKIVHGDLKPENIFLSKSEGDKLQPKIVDFGIAQVDLGSAQRATAVGVLLGSPAYLSPEQTRGAEVDHRTDVWSLSVILYEISTGTLPFVGPDHAATLVSIVETEPTPMTEHGAGDAALWAIVARGLAKDPEQRFHTIRQLGEALANWLVDKGIKQDITGASLDATWVNGIRGASLETLNSLPPPAREHARDSVETLFEAEAAAAAPEPAAPSRAVLVVAVLAGIVGIGAGVGLGSRFLGPSAPSASAPLAAASAPASAKAPISRVVRAAAPSVAQPPTLPPADAGVRAEPSRAAPPRRPREGGRSPYDAKRPRPALKDPFE